jgi:predicted nucleotidyltransferase
MAINKDLKDKRAEILRIAGNYRAHNVRVFGSLARGQAGQTATLTCW